MEREESQSLVDQKPHEDRELDGFITLQHLGQSLAHTPISTNMSC